MPDTLLDDPLDTVLAEDDPESVDPGDDSYICLTTFAFG